MGAVSDLTNLVAKLIESVKDRKAAGELREVQRMIAGFQSEQAALHEQRLELLTENANLKQKVLLLEQRVSDAERGSMQEEADASQFVEHYGVLFKRKPDGGYHQA